MMVNTKLLPLVFCGLLVSPIAWAHDTWIETNASRVPVGEYTYINLMLGNHGNDHRDFKLASKITLAPCELFVIDPLGETTDLIPRIIDMGSAPKEGFWAAKYDCKVPGEYRFVHTLDTLHLTTRAIKSSKTFLIASEGSNTEASSANHDECHGFGLELVLETPFNKLGAGTPFTVRVTRNGVPLADTKVTVIPRGVTLADNYDDTYEQKSDMHGNIQFVPQEGNVYLIVVHHPAPEEKGEGFDKTHYSATMVLNIPNRVSGQ